MNIFTSMGNVLVATGEALMAAADRYDEIRKSQEKSKKYYFGTKSLMAGRECFENSITKDVNNLTDEELKTAGLSKEEIFERARDLF